MTAHVAVIGAGVAGTAAAVRLRAAGCNVHVFEKSRGPGGRMATRRQDGHAFDHGAQYFTARDPAFIAQVRLWVANGSVVEWRPRLAEIGNGQRRHKVAADNEPVTRRYIGVPGMSAPAGHLAGQLDVRYQCRIDAIEVRERALLLAGQAVSFDAIVMTPPPEQVAVLLPAGSPLSAQVHAVRMRPCWAVMARFPMSVGVDFDAAFVNDGPLSWISNNSTRPGRPPGHCWVMHATPAWTENHMEADAGEVAAVLCAAFFAAVDRPVTVPSQVTAHRWRYALAAQPLASGCLWDPATRIAVAGDWCHGSRVEGAWLSGVNAAERIIPAIGAGEPG